MKTIRKVGDVLRQFTPQTPEHTLTGLARALDASPSGTFDVVDGLVKIGFLARVGRGRYRLGPFVGTLAAVLEDSNQLAEAAQDVMDRLFAEYGETLHLSQADGDHLMVLSARRGRRVLNVAQEVLNNDMMLHHSPASRLLLAHTEPQRVAAYWKRAEAARRAAGRPEAAEIARLRDTGYAVGPLERQEDIVLTAALIRNHAGLVAGVLSFAVPASRHDREPRAFRTVTMRAAADISGRLGYVPPK